MELKYYDFDVSDLPRNGSVSDDELREEILRPYKDVLPTSLGWRERKMPGVFVEGVAKDGSGAPLCGYVIQKGAPLYMLDYSVAYLKNLLLMRRFGRSTQSAACREGYDAERTESVSVVSADGQQFGACPTRFSLSVGYALSSLKIGIVWALVAPVAFLFRCLYSLLPEWIIKVGFTSLSTIGIVASRCVVASVLIILFHAICSTSGRLDYSMYLIRLFLMVFK